MTEHNPYSAPPNDATDSKKPCKRSSDSISSLAKLQLASGTILSVVGLQLAYSVIAAIPRYLNFTARQKIECALILAVLFVALLVPSTILILGAWRTIRSDNKQSTLVAVQTVFWRYTIVIGSVGLITSTWFFFVRDL
jgi:hypothetical protein